MALRCAVALPLHQPLEVSVFVFSSTDEALALHAALPLADTVVTLPPAHLEIMSNRTTYNVNIKIVSETAVQIFLRAQARTVKISPLNNPK
jgi:hypothetical protein